MNILDNKLDHYDSIPKPNVHEIKFSNGGHLFALMDGHVIYVYRFYTMETPPYFIFNAHDEKIMSI